MVCCPFHNKKRSFHNIPDRYCQNLSDIIAINICKQGSDNMRIAICDDEVSMVQILEEKIKKLLPDVVIDKYLSDVYKRQCENMLPQSCNINTQTDE